MKKSKQKKRKSMATFRWADRILLGKIESRYGPGQYLITPYKTRLAFVVSENRIISKTYV